MGDFDRWFHPTRLLEYWFFVIPVFLGLCVFAVLWIDRRAWIARERELVRLAGSRERAETLLSLEMAGHAGLSRERACEDLIRRLRGAGPARGPRLKSRRIFHRR